MLWFPAGHTVALSITDAINHVSGFLRGMPFPFSLIGKICVLGWLYRILFLARWPAAPLQLCRIQRSSHICLQITWFQVFSHTHLSCSCGLTRLNKTWILLEDSEAVFQFRTSTLSLHQNAPYVGLCRCFWIKCWGICSVGERGYSSAGKEDEKEITPTSCFILFWRSIAFLKYPC